MHNKLAQKLLSLGVSVSLMAAMVPLGWQNHTVYAEDPTIPQDMFITKSDLITLSQNTNSGTGLLATGGESDKKLRINFGTRPNPVQYYYSETSESDKRTAKAGPMTWLVAGSEQINNEDGNIDTLVLYGEEPMMSANALEYSGNSGNPTTAGKNDSRFQVDTSDKNYTPESNDSGYGDMNAKTVNSDHWGASNLRAQAQVLVDTYFETAEKAIMHDTEVTTKDTQNNVNYTTTDKLYAALCNGEFDYSSTITGITVGSSDSLVIDKTYWAGRFWLRSPFSGTGALYVQPGDSVGFGVVNSSSPAVTFAFNLDLSDVLFASAASGAAATTQFSAVEQDSAMTLRLDGSFELSDAKAEASGTTLTYSAPANSRLMVLATADDGATYQYAQKIESEASTATLDLNTVATDLIGKTITAKAWIEKDAEGQLTYATSPVDVSGAITEPETPEDPGTPDPDEPETPSHDDWGDGPSTIAGIPHWIAANGTTSVEVTENGIIWLKEESGGTSAWYGVDNSAGVFEIGSRFWVRWLNRDSDPDEFENLWEQLDDEHKNSIDGDNAWLFEIGVTSPDGTAYTNLSQQIPVYVQIGDDWDKADLQGYYVSAEQDEQVRTIFVDNQNYPEGQDTFGIMHLRHFSPYFIYDKLTDEEKSAQNQVKTGDQVSLFTISGLGLTMTLALGLMLKTNSNKRKFDE